MSVKEFLKYENEQVEVVEDGVTMIEDTTYRVFTDGTREVACSAKYPKPSNEPEPQPTVEERLTALEEQLLATDEVAVELYENQLAQEEINIAQDEALCELYEMIGV